MARLYENPYLQKMITNAENLWQLHVGYHSNTFLPSSLWNDIVLLSAAFVLLLIDADLPLIPI